jgi:hypothetical protein
LLEDIPENGFPIVGINLDVALRALYSGISSFKALYICEDAELTESMATINKSMGEPEQSSADDTFQYFSELLRSHRFLCND